MNRPKDAAASDSTFLARAQAVDTTTSEEVSEPEPQALST